MQHWKVEGKCTLFLRYLFARLKRISNSFLLKPKRCQPTIYDFIVEIKYKMLTDGSNIIQCNYREYKKQTRERKKNLPKSKWRCFAQKWIDHNFKFFLITWFVNTKLITRVIVCWFFFYSLSALEMFCGLCPAVQIQKPQLFIRNFFVAIMCPVFFCSDRWRWFNLISVLWNASVDWKFLHETFGFVIFSKLNQSIQSKSRCKKKTSKFKSLEHLFKNC